MDPASPKTPTGKRAFVKNGVKHVFGSVKSVFSPIKPIQVDENASPNASSSKKSMRRYFTISHQPTKGTEKHEMVIERPNTTSPSKSVRMIRKVVHKRKSIGTFFRTRSSFSSESHFKESNNISSYDTIDPFAFELLSELSDIIASEIIASDVILSDIIVSTKIDDAQPTSEVSHETCFGSDKSAKIKIVEPDSTIEISIDSAVAKMTDNSNFYPPGFWETVSVGDCHLRRDKPYKPLNNALKQISRSKRRLHTSDLDRYLEESIHLRAPRQLRPSSHKLRYVSTAAVGVKFPGSGQMELYPTRDKAIAALYERSAELAETCTWDPVNRIFEAYPFGQEIFPTLTRSSERFWFPTHSWPDSQNAPLGQLAPVGRVECEPFDENELFREIFVDYYGYPEAELYYGSPEHESSKENISSIASSQEPRYEAPPPSLHKCEADNESSPAELSADEFGLDYEVDSDMSLAICESESLQVNGALATSLRIEDIVRPESVASSWYIPENGGPWIDNPTRTWMDFDRMYPPRHLSHKLAALESADLDKLFEDEDNSGNDSGIAGIEMSEKSQSFKDIDGPDDKESPAPLVWDKTGFWREPSDCEVAMPTVATDAFNVDSQIWDGGNWREILQCGMTSDRIEPPNSSRSFEVAAAVDHVEHISTPTDLETYFQPGDIFQRKQTSEKPHEGVCSYASLCCHFHDASGGPLILRCDHPREVLCDCGTVPQIFEPIAENERRADFIVRVIAPLAFRPSDRIGRLDDDLSTEEAFSKAVHILWETAAQDTDEKVAELHRMFDEYDAFERKVSGPPKSALENEAEIRGILEEHDAFERKISGNSFSSGFKFSMYRGILEEVPLSDDEENEGASTITIGRAKAITLERANRSLQENERASIATPEKSNATILEKVDGLPQKNEQACILILEMVNAITLERVNLSPQENELACVRILEKANPIILERVKRSPGEYDPSRNPFAILEEDHNIRPIGKAKRQKSVRALVDVFQSRELMTKVPPILQSNSRISTPSPRFQRSIGAGSEQGMPILNVREFVDDWARGRPGSNASNADTDVSSKFGEILERVGALEDKENY